MGANHGHGPLASSGERYKGRLAAALGVAVVVLLVQVTGEASSPEAWPCWLTRGTCSPTSSESAWPLPL